MFWIGFLAPPLFLGLLLGHLPDVRWRLVLLAALVLAPGVVVGAMLASELGSAPATLAGLGVAALPIMLWSISGGLGYAAGRRLIA